MLLTWKEWQQTDKVFGAVHLSLFYLALGNSECKYLRRLCSMMVVNKSCSFLLVVTTTKANLFKMCVDCGLNLAPDFLSTNKVLLKHGMLIYLYAYPWLLWG